MNKDHLRLLRGEAMARFSANSLKDLSVAMPNLNVINVEEKLDRHILQMEYAQDVDPREDLFNYAVSSGWVILKMTPTTTDLEDIFRKLTTEGQANA